MPTGSGIICIVLIYLVLGSLCNLTTTDEVLKCTRLHHDLGNILYFDNIPLLKDLVILDPQWLFNVMATIFTTKHRWVRKTGVLKPEVLTHIWKNYPTHLHPKLLMLLEKFEVAYPVDNVESLINVLTRYFYLSSFVM